MKRKVRDNIPGALELAERTVHLLRSSGFPALAEYYIGALPFALGLLFFWSDMARNPSAASYCAPAAGGLAVLFIWMKYWQVRFCRRLLADLQAGGHAPWTLARILTTAARQGLVQASGWLALPVAFILAVPFAWVYAFYQNAGILEDQQDEGLVALARSAWRQALLWPGQNHLFLLIMSLFGGLIFLNLAMALIMLPGLLKSLLGIESVFTLSAWSLLNTTFFCSLVIISYLCVDPIIKAAYVLRCFHGCSRQNGDDLRAALKPLQVGVFLLLMAAFCPQPASAAVPPVSGMETAGGRQPVALSDYSRRLEQSIEEVMQQRKFLWRLPREEKPEDVSRKGEGWLVSMFKWVVEAISDLIDPVNQWIDRFMAWLRGLFPQGASPATGGAKDYLGISRFVLYGLGVLLLFSLGVLLLRRLRRRQTPLSPDPSQAPRAALDLSDEAVSAQDLPTDKWLALASELMQRQDFTHALRALYLSILSTLGDGQRLVISRYKSNLDYRRELGRKAHAEQELVQLFAWCTQAFERVWYGMHPASKAHLDRFFDYQQRIRRLVQPAA